MDERPRRVFLRGFLDENGYAIKKVPFTWFQRIRFDAI